MREVNLYAKIAPKPLENATSDGHSQTSLVHVPSFVPRFSRAGVAAGSSDSASGNRGVSSPGGRRDGDEENSLRATTVKYLRDSITVEQFYDEVVDVVEKRRGGGRRIEEAVIARLARGMPEEKAWSLMEAHRKRRHEERLSKKRQRRSRRRHAEAASKRKTKKSTALAEPPGEVDDRWAITASKN